MAILATRPSYRRRILQAMGNQSPEELGRLVLDMMENTDRVYEEAGIDDNGIEADTFEYVARDAQGERGLAEAYRRLQDEYRRRFGGIDNIDPNAYRERRDRRVYTDSTPSEPLPLTQPPADDITVGINPDTGVEETVLGEGAESLVTENDIFGEDIDE